MIDVGRELVRIALVMSGALGIAGVGWGCSSAAFACDGNSQCGADGLCEPQGYCSFPDLDCASGRRFGEGSSNVSGACVPVTPGEGSSSADSTATGSAGGSGVTTAGPIGTTTGEGSSSTNTPVVDDDGSSTASVPLTSSGPTEPDTTGPGSAATTDGSSSTGESVERVEEGIAVFYRFDAPGSTIEDRAGVDPPIDLALEGDGFTWTETGLVIDDELAIIRSVDSVTRLRTACQASEEITVEAWISSTLADQIPSRIVTLSETNSGRNFTLGVQDELGVVWRVRTEDAFNGLPQLVATESFVPGPTHIVATHASGGEESVYVDGVPAVTGIRAGSFAMWDADPAYQLALGNENDLTRPWHGEFHLVAVYDRALSEDEVSTNFAARF